MLFKGCLGRSGVAVVACYYTPVNHWLIIYNHGVGFVSQILSNFYLKSTFKYKVK